MKLRALVLLTILIAIPAIAQQTASGHLLTGAGSAAQASAFVRFRLDNYGLNVAKISGSGVLVQPPPDIFPNAVTGLWSTSIYDNDSISPAGTQWIAEYWWNGQLQYSAPYTLTGGGPYNLDSLAPNYTQPVIPSPTGDTTYLRKDGGNLPFSTFFTAKGYNGRAMAETYSGDYCAKWSLAMADGGATANIFDNSNQTGSATCAASPTGLSAGKRHLFGTSNVSLGANQITVAAGVNNVELIGVNNGAPNETTTSSMFSTTGTQAAIKVGTTSADTYGFLLRGITANMVGAGDGAVGLQLNRAVNYYLENFTCYPNVSTAFVSGQRCIDTNGTGDFTGGVILRPYLPTSKNGYGLYGGTAFNANAMIGGQVPCASGGTGVYLTDNASGGNFFLGPDIENCAIGLRVAQSGNFYVGRFEGNTINVQLDSGAQNNRILVASDSHGCNPTFFTDNSANTSNSVECSATMPHYWVDGSYRQRTFLDLPILNIITMGSTADQNWDLIIRDHLSANRMDFGVDSSHNIFIGDGTLTRFLLAPSGNNTLDASAGSNATNFGSRANSGTGGINVYSGGSSPVLAWGVGGAGTVGTYGKIATVANGIPSEYAQINSLANTASIGSATLYAVPGAGIGMYRVSYYVATQTAGSAGTVSITLGWSDGITSKSFTSATADLTVNTLASVASGSYVIRANNSTNITYATTVTGATGSPSYAVFVRVEAL